MIALTNRSPRLSANPWWTVVDAVGFEAPGLRIGANID